MTVELHKEVGSFKLISTRQLKLALQGVLIDYIDL